MTDTIINNIAREFMEISTLEMQNSDELDFHEVAVWQLKDALQAAYDAGRASPKLGAVGVSHSETGLQL